MTARRTGTTGLLIGLLVGVVLVLGLGASHASARQTRGARQINPTLPRVPTDLNTPRRELAIRPGAIVYTGDGTGLLAGTSVRRPSHIRWTSWSTSSAFGQGANQLDNCVPSCAGGRFTGYPVRLEMWKPARLHGVLVFTRLTIWYTGRRPAGEPVHYTFSDLYSGGWGFSPPDAVGYCTHTSGQPPAVGCANISALPPVRPQPA
jgi:hypothetical protein